MVLNVRNGKTQDADRQGHPVTSELGIDPRPGRTERYLARASQGTLVKAVDKAPTIVLTFHLDFVIIVD